MSRIIFQESYIVVIPSFSKTATHKHPFMHLFVGANGCKIKVEKKELQSNIIMLDSNVKHAVEDGTTCDFFYWLILQVQLRRKLLTNMYVIAVIMI